MQLHSNLSWASAHLDSASRLGLCSFFQPNVLSHPLNGTLEPLTQPIHFTGKQSLRRLEQPASGQLGRTEPDLPIQDSFSGPHQVLMVCFYLGGKTVFGLNFPYEMKASKPLN